MAKPVYPIKTHTTLGNSKITIVQYENGDTDLIFKNTINACVKMDTIENFNKLADVVSKIAKVMNMIPTGK